jgi:hypothetical protein
VKVHAPRVEPQHGLVPHTSLVLECARFGFLDRRGQSCSDRAINTLRLALHGRRGGAKKTIKTKIKNKNSEVPEETPKQ